MKTLLRKIDPYRQSCLYFKWTFNSVVLVAVLIGFLWRHIDGKWADIVFNNSFIYLPNYLVHEFSHRIWCMFGWEWWCYASGNGMETLVPLAACFGVLHIRGGRYLLPPLLYWLSTTLYGAGVYAADARAMQLPLTSSDMVSTFAPGEVKGDWYYILEPLGLLEQDVLLGRCLMFLAVVSFVFALWSLWYYWTHVDEYMQWEKDYLC